MCLIASAHLPFFISCVWPQARTCIFLFHMSDHKRAPVFFYFICLTTSACLSFSTVYVWSRDCVCLFLLHVWSWASFSTVCVLLWARARLFSLFMSNHDRVLAFFYFMCLIASAHLPFFISCVWPQARTCIFLFHMSGHKRAPVFFHFIYWVRACARFFLLYMSDYIWLTVCPWFHIFDYKFVSVSFYYTHLSLSAYSSSFNSLSRMTVNILVVITMLDFSIEEVIDEETLEPMISY